MNHELILVPAHSARPVDLDGVIEDFVRLNDQRKDDFGLKGKVFPYSLPSVGLGADPGVHIPSSSLPLLSAGPAVTPVAFTRRRYL